MPTSSSSAATASQPQSQPQSPDVEQLIGLLGNLMPLLLRFQSQTFEQPLQGGNFMIPDPALDRQAAENFIGDIIAESLRNLSAYLEGYAGQYAGLEACVPIVTQAAHRFAMRDYAHAFNLMWLAYRAIEAARAADPRIPPPRTASSGQASPSARSSSVH
jgi:hypothetical protein